MPTPLTLPDCLMRTYEWLYPTIDFTLVKFYVGLPAVPDSPGAITVPDAVSARGVGVYLNGAPDFCSEETFLLIAHELVHVLQMQQQGGGLGLFRPFTVGYYTCATISGGSAGRDNPYEREAYDYANGPPPGAPAAPKGRLRQCIDGSAFTPPLPTLLPCSCTGAVQLHGAWPTGPWLPNDSAIRGSQL
jgi:hypothetical protein